MYFSLALHRIDVQIWLLAGSETQSFAEEWRCSMLTPVRDIDQGHDFCAVFAFEEAATRTSADETEGPWFIGRG